MMIVLAWAQLKHESLKIIFYSFFFCVIKVKKETNFIVRIRFAVVIRLQPSSVRFKSNKVWSWAAADVGDGIVTTGGE